ncbi:hypothetical protein PMIT1318_01867 [Prochlorococcus marinus str. MIT 1318]|uniref:FkbM family methyltransferase n=1 Tax=Prochlorococcus TaxID=1218 RepID=UPI0007B3917C|nr:FkbM family methyltransferase [Prochlorococcus marinus]KZR70727.1 hypothetical protein PMIT1318_01867 [Prochlorococcus marinus str. MIT 1318]
MKSVEKLCKIYSAINHANLIGTFEWADLGSFGAADSYLIPLTSLDGGCLCIEGRNDTKDASNAYMANKEISANIIPIKTFISGNNEKRFFFESPEGGGSTFYPCQDILSRWSEDVKPTNLKRSVIDCKCLAEVVRDNLSSCIFLKADLEGAEIECIESIVNNNGIENPLLLEVEINVGERGPSESMADGLRKYEAMGYRLLDMRKTYFYPSSESKLIEEIKKEHVFAPYFQGCIHQFDFLLIRVEMLNNLNYMNEEDVLKACLILYLYRQFHLTAFILERLNSDKSKVLLDLYGPKIYSVFKEAAFNNQSSLWGYDPLFNWLKST